MFGNLTTYMLLSRSNGIRVSCSFSPLTPLWPDWIFVVYLLSDKNRWLGNWSNMNPLNKLYICFEKKKTKKLMLTKILTTGNLWMVIFGEVKISFSMLLWNDRPLKGWRFSAVGFSSLKHTCEVLSGEKWKMRELQQVTTDPSRVRVWRFFL